MEVIEGKKTHLRLVNGYGITGMRLLGRQCLVPNCRKAWPLPPDPIGITSMGALLRACEDHQDYLTREA